MWSILTHACFRIEFQTLNIRQWEKIYIFAGAMNQVPWYIEWKICNTIFSWNSLIREDDGDKYC